MLSAQEVLRFSQFVHDTLRPMTVETWDMNGLCEAIEEEYPEIEYALDFDLDPDKRRGKLTLAINHPAEVTIYGEVTDSGGGVPGRRICARSTSDVLSPHQPTQAG